MDYVWRRHLQAAARRSSAREGQDDRHPNHKAVGFADLVGFTALSQQVDEHVLAAVVDRFESIAYDTVVKLGGRVVKMIGDEVMFVVEEVRPAVEIALTLAEAYSRDEELSEVRVGLACGPTLEREADYYGPDGEPGQSDRQHRLPRLGGHVGRRPRSAGGRSGVFLAISEAAPIEGHRKGVPLVGQEIR